MYMLSCSFYTACSLLYLPLQTVQYICRDGMIMISDNPGITDRVEARCREGYVFDLPQWPTCRESKENLDFVSYSEYELIVDL